MEPYPIITWVKANGIGDVAAIADFAIALVGFIATGIGIHRSRRAAVEAKNAAQQALQRVKLIENVLDFTGAIATLEEIKKLHRQGDAWSIMPERYTAIRRHLIQLRGSGISLSPGELVVIQNAVVNLSTIEDQVERHLAGAGPPKANLLNRVVSSDIDALVAVLTSLRNQGGGK